MARLELTSGSLAVAEERLVCITAVNLDGLVAVRDLATGKAATIEASVLHARFTEHAQVQLGELLGLA
jgi:hypothetical protein